MGADATAATAGRLERVRGGLEATGMGIKRLAGLDLADPIFNWDEVPIKQGLHNRHLVGLMAMNTFLGFAATDLEEGLARADVVFTATGRDGAVPPAALAPCKSGAFLANLGHTNGELPVAELKDYTVAAPRPHVQRCEVEGRTLYLLAGGAMFNLAAGPGDLTTPPTW
jgi:adenosylhomocysteinase